MIEWGMDTSPWSTPTLPDHYLGPQPHPLSIMAGRPWPKSYADLAPLLDGPLLRQSKAFERRFSQVADFRHETQDKVYAQLAILAEFWRMKQAMDDFSAERAVMFIKAIPMCPYDYHVSLAVENIVNPDKIPWWKRNRKDQGVKLPTVFPTDILGYGARAIVEHGQITAQSLNRRYAVIRQETPLVDTVEALFGPQYAQDVRQHLARRSRVSP